MNHLFGTGIWAVLMIACDGCVGVHASEGSRPTDDTVEVAVKSGRLFVGELDRRTDETTLWLSYGTSRTTLVRPIRWQSVLAVKRQGVPIAKSEVIDRAGSVARREPNHNSRSSKPSRTTSSKPLATAPVEQVRSVEADARLANWDGDIENDGLMVTIRPLDEDGRALAIDGVLQATLTTSKRESFHRVSRGVRVGSIAQWSVALDASQWRGDVFVVRLAFPSVDFQSDTMLAPYGLVHLRLVVPGHGTFERSIDGVRIRPFSPLRP